MNNENVTPQEPPKELSKEEKKAADVSKVFHWNRYDAAVADLLIETERKAPERLIVEFSRLHRELSDYAFWFLLGMIWTRYPDPAHAETWSKLFLSERPERERSLMKPSELRFFHAMPKTITAYRPYDPDEHWVINYTPRIEVARRIATASGRSSIAAYSIPRENVIAYFDRRKTPEVIAVNPLGIEETGLFPLVNRT